MRKRPYALVRRPAGNTGRRNRDVHRATTARRHGWQNEQWQNYVAALGRSGWPTVVIDGDDSMPDCVFIEDTVDHVRRPCGHHHSVTAQPQAGNRCGATGNRRVSLKPPRSPREIGRRRRPEDRPAGVRRTQRHDNSPRDRPADPDPVPRGYTVTAVPLTKALHLRARSPHFRTAPSSGTNRLSTTRRYSLKFLAVPEEQGAHVVILGDDLH